jgi:iron complex outermembrane recepter protein
MASVYQLTQSNVLTTDLDHPDFQVQSGEVRVRGAELSAVGDLGNGLSIITGYTWMDGVQLRNNDGTQGKRPRDVPRSMANLWLDKTFLSGPLRGFGVAAGFRYVGSTYGDLANTLRLPSTTLVDAAIRYEIPQWRFSLNAQNLFDKEYIGSCQGETGCQYGLRRAWMAKATFSW